MIIGRWPGGTGASTAVTRSSALSASGTVTKWYGAGPRHDHTSPLNSSSTGAA